MDNQQRIQEMLGTIELMIQREQNRMKRKELFKAIVLPTLLTIAIAALVSPVPGAWLNTEVRTLILGGLAIVYIWSAPYINQKSDSDND